jgi:undecaprenyl-diphosphooligosaccharide--protein glycosyltransferase
MKKDKYINNTWLFVAVLLACFAVSAGARYQQFETWKQTPKVFFVGERPMMTTLDAPYWLRWAREYNEGVYRGVDDGLREYPERTKIFLERSVPEKFKDQPVDIISDINKGTASKSSLHPSAVLGYSDVPLLSLLIAKLAPVFNFNYYLTGTLLIPVLASLFVLPLGVYFFHVGVPLSGLLGGLIGTFAGGYYMRSSIGRIDTDMLNLFFPLLTSLLILLAGKTKMERNVLLYALGAGFSLFLFSRWYSQAGFTLAYFIVLVFSLIIQKVRFRSILLSTLLFILSVQPVTFMSGTPSVKTQFTKYFVIENRNIDYAQDILVDNRANPATFPNTMTTISEVDPVPMDEVLRRILSNATLAWIGFLGFFGMVVFRWRVLIPLVPMLALGLLSFQSSNRFIMYLAPFIGIGLGWLLQLGIDWIFILLARMNTESTNKKGLSVKGLKTQLPKTEIRANVLAKVDYWNWERQGALYLGIGVFFWLISGQTAISFVPRPSIHSGLYATFLEVKKRVPTDSVLLTWWDYGYAITDATGLATFHDGGSQNYPKTYFIARSLISSDPYELYDITQYLATEGNRGIAKNNTSHEALVNAVRNPTIRPWDPIYLFFTADMTGKYGAISKLGTWDIINGGSKPRGYQNLACNKITSEEMNCRGAKIDLKVGKINNQLALKRVLFIRDGEVMREQKFEHTQGYTLQMLVSGNQIVEVQLIDEEVYRSNYNQMFLLGRYEGELFEETYNAFPFSRLFKIKF